MHKMNFYMVEGLGQTGYRNVQKTNGLFGLRGKEGE